MHQVPPRTCWLNKARCEQCRKKTREYVARKEAEAKQAKPTTE